MIYIPRLLSSKLLEYLQFFPVVGITGPRQSGKSTLVNQILGSEYRYITFDDYRHVEFFQSDPERFISEYNSRVVFDEVQKVPDLFSYIKRVVDQNRNLTGQFVLTGSSQFTLNQQISESLAGRIGLLSLLPFQFSEIPEKNRSEVIVKGSYPELVVKGHRFFEDWFNSYVETFILRDVKSLINIGDLRDFRQFIRLLAVQAGQLLNLTDISKSIGISVSTVKRWISVLEAAYVVFLLPPYYTNLSKRLIKRPKLYFWDTGLVCFLSGISSLEMYEKGPMSGALFENYVISEIHKRYIHEKRKGNLYFIRTSNQVEVDLIIEEPGTKTWIEVKKTSTPRLSMCKSIESLKPASEPGFIIYEGENYSFSGGMKAVNYKNYLLQ